MLCPNTSDIPTNCCPMFKSEGWDVQELHFKDKLFVKAKTISIFYIPLNMGSVFPNTFNAKEKATAKSAEEFIILSHDPSAWTIDHYFSATKDVPGQEMLHLTGDFLTKVFEGPYKDTPKCQKEMEKTICN